MWSPTATGKCNGYPWQSLCTNFQVWLLTDFARVARSVESYGLDPSELTERLCPWVQLIAQSDFRTLLPEDAAILRSLLNQALDRIERHCDRYGQRFADVLLDLSPLEDILVALMLAEVGLFYQPQQNCAEGISERL